MSSLALIGDGDKPNIAIEGNPVPISNEASLKESLLTLKQKVLCIVRSGRKDNPNVHVLTFDSNGKSKLNFVRITKGLLQEEPKDSELNTASILDLTDSTGTKVIPGFFNQGVEVGWDVSEWDPFKADPGKFVIKFYSNIDLDGVTDEINTEMGLEEFLKLFSDENINRTLVRIERVVPGQKNPEAYAALRIPSGKVNSQGVGLDLLLLLTDKASLERHLFKVNDRTVASDARDKMAEILSQLRSLNPLLNAQIQKEIELMKIPNSGKFIKSIEEMRLWSKYFTSKEGKYYERLQGIKKPLARVLTHMLGMLIGKGKIESSRLDFSNVTNTKPRKESSVFQIEGPEQKAIEAPKEKEITLGYVWGVSIGGQNAVIKDTSYSDFNLNILVSDDGRLKYYSIPDSSVPENGVPCVFSIEAEENLEGAFVLNEYGRTHSVAWSKDVLEISPLNGEGSKISLNELIADLPEGIEIEDAMRNDEIREVVVYDTVNIRGDGISKSYVTIDGKQVPYGNSALTFFDTNPRVIIYTKNGYSYVANYLGSSIVKDIEIYRKYVYRQKVLTNEGYKDWFVKRKNPRNRICLAGFEKTSENTFSVKNPRPMITRGAKSFSIVWQRQSAVYGLRSPGDVSIIASANALGSYETNLGFHEREADMPKFFFVGTKNGELIVYENSLDSDFKAEDIIFSQKPFASEITGIISGKYPYTSEEYQHLVLVTSGSSESAVLYKLDTRNKTLDELCKIKLPLGTKALKLASDQRQSSRERDPKKRYFYLLTETNGVLVNNSIVIDK